MKFKLKTKFTKIPEQEKAIGDLVKNINNNVRYQTLLGVTGSGKSLSYDEPVLIYEKIKDKFTPYLIEIGRLVEDKSFVNKRLYVPSINPNNGKQELKAIFQLTRHKSPKRMYSVKTSCGKEIEVTGDHNFWIVRNGNYKLVKTVDISKYDYIPLPRNIEIDNIKPINSLQVNDYLQGNSYFRYIDIAKEIKLNYLKKCLGYRKYWRVVNKNEGINIKELNKFKLSKKCIQEIKIFKKGGKYIVNKIDLNLDFLSLLGIYIAEGHSENRCLMISVHENNFIKIFKRNLSNLKIKSTERDYNKGDFLIYSKILSDLFSNLCGNNSRNKRLPSWFMQLDKKGLSHILSSYFSGDGNVTDKEIQATTASRKLCNDLSYALLRYGVIVRIRKKHKFATNTLNKKRRLYYEIIISGKSNLTKFKNEIGFVLKRKQLKLSKIIKINENTNVDLVPINGEDFKKLRQHIGLTHRTLSELVGCTRSYITMIENNSRRPSNKLLIKILDIFEENTESNLLHDDITKFRNLTKIFCTNVKEIKKIDSHSDFVYDVAVRDNETFLAGMGGIYVHNTFTVANVIEKVQRPTLIISHNKTLAAQLYQEMRDLFPKNAVSYFVSYYDYYQPESYIPSTDTYIEKDSAINELIDKLRLAATTNLLTRKDTIVVASVSCIYNIGSPVEYGKFVFEIISGMKVTRKQIIERLIDLQYERSEFGFHRGTFRVRGDKIDVFPAYTDSAVRIEVEKDKISKLSLINPLSGEITKKLENSFTLYPAKHFMTDPRTHEAAFKKITVDLDKHVKALKKSGKLLEAQRISQRVKYDLEMIKEVGYVKGIENYSRYFDGRSEGDAPYSLLDYFKESVKDDWLVVVDESHMTFPQIRGMYAGDFSRKSTLIDYGFRLPSALDNRPLKFEEFIRRIPNFIALSATPNEWELSMSEGKVVEQLLRPTGIPDPEVVIKPTTHQVKDVILEIKKEIKEGRRVLVTTLTKKTAEDLSTYLNEQGLKVAYLHSDVDTLDRTDILDNLRRGKYDVLVGINLLREGLDLPEVGLVAILDADKEGFLRSETSLIQTMGRAARHVKGRVIMYADRITGSMERALDEVKRRREYQLKMNKKYNITPKSIEKPFREKLIEKEKETETEKALGYGANTYAKLPEIDINGLTPMDKKRLIKNLKKEMILVAKELNFELAAEIRDKIKLLS